MITHLPAERVNFWTHAAGFLAWIPVTVAMTLMAWPRPDLVTVCLIYGLGVMFLFFCSAWYHRNKTQENERSLWRTLDHVAIFVMIASTYTPVVWIWFDEPWRTATLTLQWSVTTAGLVFKLFVPRAPRWIGPMLYLLMGWVAIAAVVPLYQKMPFSAFAAMLGGGAWYTVGAVVYATKRPRLWPGTFGFHEFFHVFILAGAATHGFLVFRSLAAALARGGTLSP